MPVSFEEIKKNVESKFYQIPSRLSYHNMDHTLDVTEQTERIALEEGINDHQELLLLKTAALYHDTGYLHTYVDHEEKSCNLFRDDNSEYAFNNSQVESICAIIMATKMPQQPEGLFQQIICDADLDYLGREDFFSLASLLRKEFFYFGIVKDENEWQTNQIHFLEAHHFFTKSSMKEKELIKQDHLQQLKATFLNGH